MNEISSKFNIVMVIDDNNIDMYITASVVSKNNFAAKTLKFSSGREAFEYLTENKNHRLFMIHPCLLQLVEYTQLLKI